MHLRFYNLLTLIALSYVFISDLGTTPVGADCIKHDGDKWASIERLHLPREQGEGYRMTYCVDLPLEIFWQFKTDFHNEFLTSNPHIEMHRFVGRDGNAVLTENRYAHNSEKLFRWQTRVYASQYRMDFKLLNPDEAGQTFHFGTIRLEPGGRHTVVHQSARFQFSGATLWAFYPWRGGMRAFLQSFVNWEREAALTWLAAYDARRRKEAIAQARLKQIFSVNKRYPDK